MEFCENLEILYNNIVKNDADLSCGSFDFFDDNNPINECTVPDNKILIIVRSVSQISFSLFKSKRRKYVCNSQVVSICRSVRRHSCCCYCSKCRCKEMNTFICVKIHIVGSFSCCFSFHRIQCVPPVVLNWIVCNNFLLEHHITVLESDEVTWFHCDCSCCFFFYC